MDWLLGFVTTMLFFVLGQTIQHHRLQRLESDMQQLLDDHKPLG